MGDWRLEVFKMGVCIMFPIGMFYAFNHPQFGFGEKLELQYRKQFLRESAPDSVAVRNLVDEYKEETRVKQHAEWQANHDRLVRIQAEQAALKAASY